MTGRSRRVLRLVTGRPDGAPRPDAAPGEAHDHAPRDDAAAPWQPTRPAPVPTTTVDAHPAETDPAELVARIEASVDDARRRAAWAAVRELADPDDLARLLDQVAALEEAALSVRRQHTETAEDLGPLWDTWAGPAAEAVQDRVSALARSAQALVSELESTADELADAHDRIVAALGDVADRRAEPAACEQAASVCRAAWDTAHQVIAGGVS